MHNFTGIYVIALEQPLNIICYTNNLIIFIWSYIQWIYKKRYINLLHIPLLSNIWYKNGTHNTTLFFYFRCRSAG